MSISQLFIIAAFALLIGQIKTGRRLALLGVSAFMVYWLQPPQARITLTFWLPTATLVLTMLAWLLTSTPEERGWKQNAPAVTVLLGVMLLMDLNRYCGIDEFFITATPAPQWLVAVISAWIVLSFVIARWSSFPPVLFVFAALGLILLLVLIKVPSALTALFETIFTLRGKRAPGAISLSWLGFSYVSFRLLHTILDRRAGRLPSVPLADYVNYVIFFPSFTAGPIDRLERFTRDLHEPIPLDNRGWVEAGTRFFTGLFRKFVLADGLAWIALNEDFLRAIHSPGWLWLLLYAYSLRIYFDFSGYTDIAIGLGRFLGVRLPENFAAPYLKPNLTSFWNSWHMTLTQWFRSYLFNPLTRALRSSNSVLPASVVIFSTQIVTMITIGLWHGIAINFVCWGLWHGIGLFVQNRWSDFLRGRSAVDQEPSLVQHALKYTNIFLTFNYVSLGWLFFMFPSPTMAWQALLKLMGLAL